MRGITVLVLMLTVLAWSWPASAQMANVGRNEAKWADPKIGLLMGATWGAVSGGDAFPVMSLWLRSRAHRPQEERDRERRLQVELGVQSTQLGDFGDLAIAFQTDRAQQDLRVDIEESEWMWSSSTSFSLEKPGMYTISPTILWKWEKLFANRQARPFKATFTLFRAREVLKRADCELVLRGADDCPLMVKFDQAPGMPAISPQFLPFVVAGFVNEDDPEIDKILREALDLGVVDAFTGYQGCDSPDETVRAQAEMRVDAQAFAIFCALRNRGISYSSITAVAPTNPNVFSQHIRLFSDAINNRQANCIDGAIVFASIFRKVGLNSLIVLVPGHAYVAYTKGPTIKDGIRCLETTMLAAEPSDKPLHFGAVKTANMFLGVCSVQQAAAGRKVFADSSAFQNVYVHALDSAQGNFSSNLEKLSKSEFGYAVVGVEEARRSGVAPIPTMLPAVETAEKRK